MVLSIAGYYLLGVRNSSLERINPPYSPEVLAQKGREVVQRLGFTDAPADEAYGFNWDTAYRNYVQNNDKPAPHWNEVLTQRPTLLKFWYRQSPYPLTAGEFHDDLLTPGVVDSGDPPPILTGMIGMELDAQGRLLYFERIPAQRQSPATERPAMDWNPLFAAAGLDPAQFKLAEPLWTWLATSDTRVAWTGTWPGSTRPLRVEAAALRSRPVAFSLIGPWTPTDRMPNRESSNGERGEFAILLVISLAICAGTWLLVRRNTKKGSGAGDHEGAMRLARFVGYVQIGLWLFRSHLAPSMGTFGMLLIALATAIFYAFVVRAMYIALEPYVRRRWPQTIISSTAVLTGHWRDPIVGRDVLIGTALAIMLRVMLVGLSFPGRDAPNLGYTDVLLGIRSTVAVCFKSIPHGIRETLVFFFLIFLLRVLLRNQWLACAGFTLIFAALSYFQSSHPVTDGLLALVVYGLVAFIVLRFGLLAMSAYIFVDGLLSNVQATMHTSAWYLGNSLFLLACVVALAAWGFHTSIAGRRLWKEDLLA